VIEKEFTMKWNNPTALLASMGLGAALAVSVGAFAHDPKPTMGAPAMESMAGHSEGSMQLQSIMSKGSNMSMPMSGNVDKDFAMMMSMHHQMAIDMVDVLLKHGSNPALKAMAMKMKAAQTKEIKQMAPYTK